MAKIIHLPKQIDAAPHYDFRKYQNYRDFAPVESAWVDSLKAFLKAKSSDPLVGEEVSFQIADGYARYIVAGTKPLQLIHLDLGDGYQFPYVNRLTLSDIKQKIEQAKALSELFASRSK